MKIIADFHFHSKYSRAVSSKMIISEIIQWANWKGIDLLGSGDFTHPLWLGELKRELEPLDNGLFKPKSMDKPRFILSAELSSIYTQHGKVRKIHNVIIAPSFETVQKINEFLMKIGNLYSDGRPILGISAKDLAKIIFNIDPRCMFIPAHAWTPWFSVFGSKSGFDTLEECFEELTPKIYAIETGLSSDPEMNWRLSKLDPITLISCSDAHSPANLGREATVFEFSSDQYSYDDIINAIKFKSLNPESLAQNPLKYTIEFFPEEGMYHFDGHRACGNLSFHPDKSKKMNKICPKCNKELTIGVLHRVCDLADREEGFKPVNFPGSVHLVPLQEIIAEALGVAKTSKKVQDKYIQIVNTVGNEFDILLNKSLDELSNDLDSIIVDGIRRVREKKVQVIPGYDGVYGKVNVFGDEDEKEKIQKKQASLF